MIGPRAYENLFQTVTHFSKKELDVFYKGMRYTYCLAGCEDLFDTVDQWEYWCMEDVRDRNGEYAYRMEAIE